jgi:hypothetical protein
VNLAIAVEFKASLEFACCGKTNFRYLGYKRAIKNFVIRLTIEKEMKSSTRYGNHFLIACMHTQ